MQKNGSKTAVLVIDVQNGLFGASPPPHEAEQVIQRINALTSKARAAGLPVFFVQHDGREHENVLPNTPGWELDSRLEIRPADARIRKTTCDAFYRTDLEGRLRSRGIDSLVICGYATEFCIDATVRNGVSKDFQITIPQDAHTTNDSPTLNARQIREHYNWAWANCTAQKPPRVVKDVSF